MLVLSCAVGTGSVGEETCNSSAVSLALCLLQVDRLAWQLGLCYICVYMYAHAHVHLELLMVLSASPAMC